MRHRIGIALLALHASAALYLLLAAALVWLLPDEETVGRTARLGFGAICVLLALGVEVVAFGLRRRRFWAWIAGLCIFGVYVPSLFFPLGALGLWGLLDPGSRAAFRVGPSGQRN